MDYPATQTDDQGLFNLSGHFVAYVSMAIAPSNWLNWAGLIPHNSAKAAFVVCLSRFRNSTMSCSRFDLRMLLCPCQNNLII